MMYPRIKELRETTDLSAKAFASELGIPYTTYYGYESGAREPGHVFLMQLADRFSVTVDYILGRDEKQKSPEAAGTAPEDSKNKITAEELESRLIAHGFIKPGQDLEDRDLEFLISVGNIIKAWFDGRQ